MARWVPSVRILTRSLTTVVPEGGAGSSRSVFCCGNMADQHDRPCRDQKSGQFLVRTRIAKSDADLCDPPKPSIPAQAASGAGILRSVLLSRAKSGQFSVRTRRQESHGLLRASQWCLDGAMKRAFEYGVGRPSLGGKKRTVFGPHPCPQKGSKSQGFEGYVRRSGFRWLSASRSQ